MYPTTACLDLDVKNKRRRSTRVEPQKLTGPPPFAAVLFALPPSLPCVCLPRRKISYEPDAATEAVVAAMPSSVGASGKAGQLGLLVKDRKSVV